MDADMDVTTLNWNPTAGDWAMTAPTDAVDIAWMTKALKERAPRIAVHEVGAAPCDDEESAAKSPETHIDWGAVGQ